MKTKGRADKYWFGWFNFFKMPCMLCTTLCIFLF